MKILLFAIAINLFRDGKSNLIMISNARTKKAYVIELNKKGCLFY